MRVAMPTPDDVAALLALQRRSETLAEDIAAAPVRALAAAIERNDAAPAATRLPELRTGFMFCRTVVSRRLLRAVMRSVAASCRRCRCRAGCGPAAAFTGRRETDC